MPTPPMKIIPVREKRKRKTSSTKTRAAVNARLLKEKSKEVLKIWPRVIFWVTMRGKR